MPLGPGAIVRGTRATDVDVDLAGDFHSSLVSPAGAAAGSWGAWTQVWAAGTYSTPMLVTGVEPHYLGLPGWMGFGVGDPATPAAVWPVSNIDQGRAGRGHPFLVPAGAKLSMRLGLSGNVAGFSATVSAVPVAAARMARRSFADVTWIAPIALGNMGGAAYGTATPICGAAFTTEDCRLIGLHTPNLGGSAQTEVQITVGGVVVFEGVAAKRPLTVDMQPLPWEPVVPAGSAVSIKWKHPTSGGSLNPPIPILVALNP